MVKMNKNKSIIILLIGTFLIMVMSSGKIFAQPLPIPNVNLDISVGNEGKELVASLQLLLLLTVLSLVPADRKSVV